MIKRVQILPDQLPHSNHTCLAISLKQLTPCSKFGNTMEPYFLHSGMGLIFKVTSVTTPRVPEMEGMHYNRVDRVHTGKNE